MKTLYLLRHAKAEAGGKDTADRDRILAPRGREACTLTGDYMRRKGYLPAFVLSSPSARTRETLERVAEAAGTTSKTRFEEPLYLATAEQIVHEIQSVDSAISSLLVVGHNPGMHHAALLLAEPHETPLRRELELKYPTCALTVLHFKANGWQEIAPGQGELADFITPGEL